MVELSVAVEFNLPDLWGCHSGLLLALWLKSWFFVVAWIEGICEHSSAHPFLLKGFPIDE